MLLVGGGQAGWAQRTHLTLHTDSQFWIQGKASSISFTCKVKRVQGAAELPTTRSALSSSADERQTEVVVRVPVQAFDCGNSRMTEDLQEALKMEKHPKIKFELVHATVGTPLDTTGTWRTVNVLGALTIAGTKRLINLEAAGHALDKHRFRVRGCKPIRMTYFNIEPPTKAFGLIKVKDRVEVQFDLLAYAPQETLSSPFKVVSVDESPSCPVGG
jgi:polyisoprenoid-binding protein YceI